MTSAKEAVRALREILEDGEFTYNSKVESRLSDVETAIANMTTRDLTDEEADAWAMRTIPAPHAHYYRRAIAAALLASNRGDVPTEVRTRGEAFAVITRVTARHSDGSQSSLDLSDSPVPLHANDRIVVTRSPDGNVPLSIAIGRPTDGATNEQGSVASGAADDKPRSAKRSADDWFSRGRAAAFREILDAALSGIGREPTPSDRESAMRRIGQLESERSDVVSALRRICEKRGDNDWEDKCHLADVLRRNLEPWLDAQTERDVACPEGALASDVTNGQPTKALVPPSLRVFRFGDYALICPRAADVCAIDIAAGTLWNDSAEPRRYLIAVVGYEGTEAAEHFTADPPGASVFSKWEDWYSEVMHRAAAEYLAASLVAGRKAERTGSLAEFEDAGQLDSTVWTVSQWFKRGSVPVPAKPSSVPAYLSTLRDDVASRLSGLPGKVPE